MTNAIRSIATAGLVFLTAGLAPAQSYPDRWVWVFGWGLGQDRDVAAVSGVLETAARGGLNGAVISCGLDNLENRDAAYFTRLARVQQKAADLGLELIPAAYSPGYGGGLLAHNKHLAEGLPVRGTMYAVQGGAGRFVPEEPPVLKNADFETHKGDKFPGFGFHDQPGQVSFADTTMRHGGQCAIRLENFTANPHGHGRVMQEIAVRPHRSYRLSLWVRTQDLMPVKAFQVSVLSGERNLAPRRFDLKPTQDWQKLVLLFNSSTNRSVRLYAGLWGGKGGKLWFDDWQIEEAGPINILRRPGTPVRVSSQDGGTVYEEGRDFARFEDKAFRLWGDFERPAVELKIPEGSRIPDGSSVRIDWFQPMLIGDSQISTCMAEPEIYEILDRETKLLGAKLKPKRVLLGFDEIRMGGTCEACRGRDMAQLLGECTTKTVNLLKKNIPGVRPLVWSDMFDPGHNAHGNYYLVEGDYTGSWKHLPKDLTMAVWGGGVRAKSLDFFDQQGFKVLVACYYDAATLDDVKAWIDAAKSHQNVTGFMYTPWTRKYDLLPAFGDLLKK